MGRSPGASRYEAHDTTKAQDAMLRGAIPAVSLGLFALFVVFAVGHVFLLPPSVAPVMAALAGGTALAFLALRVGWRRVARLPLSGNALAAGIVLLVTVNCSAHLGLTGDPGTSANFAILAVAVGLFVLSLTWLTGMLAVIVGVWLLTALTISDFPLGEYGFLIIGAAVASFLSTVIRRRLYGTLFTLKEESETQTRALAQSEQRFRLAMAGSNDGLYDWDLASGEVFWSDRIRALLADGDDFGSSMRGLAERIHREDIERVRGQFHSFLKSTSQQFEDEFRIRYADGTYRWVLVRGACTRDADGRVERLAGSLTDMSRRGVFDALTGLPNRRLLLDRLARLTSRPRGPQDEETFAVLFLDLDDFKIVNDSLGHKTGDDLLCEVAKRLQSCVRGSDTVARLGGDEFVVLLEKVHVPQGVQITLDRIVAKLGQPFHLAGRELYVRPSIGVVMDTHAYTGPEDVLRDADTAMYRAKDQLPEYAIFDATMREHLTERLRLETELRAALAREEFVVHYQTIVSLETAAVEGLEALVRWQHPQRGLLMPGEFIPVMEDTGLVIQLGAVVLRQACRQMVDWFAHMQPDDIPYLSVNLSGKHLAQENPAGVVEQILSETGFPSHRLRIEITESAIIESPRRAAAALGQLKLLGVRVLMDDFGTGQSSLAYLQKLPIDTLKIDRSFISSMTSQREGEELVRTIVRMADSLGLGVVAEGIETDEQARMLRAMRCGSGQGYLFARPAELGLVPGMRARPEAADVGVEGEPQTVS